jgi:hypothetical protein
MEEKQTWVVFIIINKEGTRLLLVWVSMAAQSS